MNNNLKLIFESLQKIVNEIPKDADAELIEKHWEHMEKQMEIIKTSLFDETAFVGDVIENLQDACLKLCMHCLILNNSFSPPKEPLTEEHLDELFEMSMKEFEDVYKNLK